jgi:hypothetical protein
MIRKGSIAIAATGLLAFAAFAANPAPVRAGQPLAVTPAVYQVAEGTGQSAASVQLVHHRHGWYRYGYGGGYGYRPYGVGYRMYRPYPVYAAPIYGAPIYGAPVYGYPGYAYPAYGYGYGYRGCW